MIRAGNDLRRKGDDLRAFGYLQRAYDIAHTPRAASQLGLCEQALGRFPEAEAHLSEALATHDAWVDAKRAMLESTRAIARKRLGKVRLTGVPPGATVTVGRRPPQKLDADAALWVIPEPTTLVIEAEGYRRATKSIAAAAGEEVTIDAGLVREQAEIVPPPLAGSAAPKGAEPASPAPTEPSPASPPNAEAKDGRATWRITGIATGAAGVGLVVAGVVLRQIASNKVAAIDRDASNDQPYNPGNGNWKTFDGAALALLVAGGAAVVGGATLYLLNRGAASSEATTTTTTTAAARPAVRLRRSPAVLPNVSLASAPSAATTVGLLGFF